MPRGGDGAACPAASPDKGRWVPRPVALARKRAQEAARHAPTRPLVSSAEASSPEPDVALPQGKGARGTTAVEPLGSEGGATGDGEAGGACVPPLAQFSAPCAVSPCIGSPGVEGGANSGVTALRHPDLVPWGINNLGEALPAI
jgi:hypothetical protein